MAQNVENWRLSRIEEELERLELPAQPAYDAESEEDLPPPPPPMPPPPMPLSLNPDDDQDIYSKVVILPAYKKNSLEDDSKEAIRRITGKYDSLGRVKPSKPFVENNIFTTNNSPPAENILSPETTAERRIVPPAPIQDTNPAMAERYLGQESKTLSENEILQVEMFYKSHKTDVYVCACVANMYFGSVAHRKSPSSSPVHNPNPDNWVFVKSGVPVLVLDSGESRRNRKLTLTIAEKGTGFTLWRDNINHLSHYKAVHGSFHTVHLSNDHTKMVGINFDDQGAATEFLARLHQITSDPNDDVLNLSGARKKKKDQKRKKAKYRPPNKSDISSPCCFTHVTKLERSDGMNILGTSAPSSPQIVRDRDHRPSLKKLSPIKMPKVSSMVPYDS